MARNYQMVDLPANEEDLLALLRYLEDIGKRFVGFHPATGKGLFQQNSAERLTGRTACHDCRHYRTTRSDIWYDQYCLAVPHQQVFDPVMGRVKDDDEPRHCRDINTGVGDCPHFEARVAGEAPHEP